MKANSGWLRFGAAALAAAVLIGCGGEGEDGPSAPTSAPATQGAAPLGTVKLFAGAGLQRAVSELAAAFEAQTGIRVEPDYGGSGVIIGRVKMGAEADLFMPGDVSYVDKLGDEVIERQTVCEFVPTIVVAKGNPKGVKGLADFLRKDLTVGLGNPKACRIGQVNQEIFRKNGLDSDKIFSGEVMLSGTVNELGVWLKMGRVDVTMVWGAIAANIADQADTVEIPREKNVISTVVVGLLKRSRRKDASRKFMAFLVSPAGRKILAAKGYSIRVPDAAVP